MNCGAGQACISNTTCAPSNPISQCKSRIRCIAGALSEYDNNITVVFTDNTTLVLENAVTSFTMPVPMNISTDAYATIQMYAFTLSPYTVFAITYAPTLDSLGAGVQLACTDSTARNPPFTVTDRLPLLSIVAYTYPKIRCTYTITYTTHGFTSTLPRVNVSFDYVPLPVLFSACPTNILSDIETLIVIQGDHFVDTYLLWCVFDGTYVTPAIYYSPTSVGCNVLYANKTSPAYATLTVTNDGVTPSADVLNITVSGACDVLKPNSVPLAGRCTCLMGYEDKGGFCQLCANGFYQPFPDQQTCLSCDSTENTGGVLGATSSAACICMPGYYRDGTCVSCPVGLDCSTSNYTVTPGFWRAAAGSIDLVPCPGGTSACTGGAGFGSSVCGAGYGGPTCAVCADGYGPLGGVCVKCPAESLNGFILFVMIVVVIGVVLVIVISTTREEEKNNTTGVTVKVLLSYWQMLFYIGKLSGTWSEQSSRFFSSLIPVTLSPSFLSVQCATSYGFYMNIMLTMLLPVLIVVGVAAVMTAVFYIRNMRSAGSYYSTDAHADNAKFTLVLLYMVHPTIAQALIRSYNCTPVSGTRTSYMTDDMSIDCTSRAYRLYIIVASLYLVVYILGFLVYVHYRLVTKKSTVQQANDGLYILDARTYIFFVRGYLNDFYLWEFVVVARKLSLVIVTALFPASVQLVWASVIIGLSLAYTVKYQPYRSYTVNKLEILALGALWITVLLGFHAKLLLAPDMAAVFVLLVLVNTGASLVLVLAAIKFMKPRVMKMLDRIARWTSLKSAPRHEFATSDVKMYTRKASGVAMVPSPSVPPMQHDGPDWVNIDGENALVEGREL